MHSCPIVSPGVMSFSPRYGHRSEPQMQAATTFTIASVGASMVGSGTSETRMSRVPWMVVARIPASYGGAELLYLTCELP